MDSPSNNSVFKSAFLAEAIFASLKEAGHAESDINIFKKGGFKKGFSNDVDQMLIAESGGNIRFEITMNRDGIYDLLPEGLFHQSRGNVRVNTVQDAVEEHKQFKEEEKLARKFFTPLEQLLFSYSAKAETAEREALFHLQTGQLNESFYHFWNIDSSLSSGPASRLLRLMPFADAIKSDIEATEAALSYMLQREVVLRMVWAADTCFLHPQNLDEQHLGVDAAMGNTVGEWQCNWNCTISEIPGRELALYAEGGDLKKVVERFVEIFVPADVEVFYDFRQTDNPQQETYENILGVGAYL